MFFKEEKLDVQGTTKEGIGFSLVIQSFGRDNEYRRTILTVLSFFAFYRGEEANAIVFTDKPEWFTNYFEGLPVSYVLLTPAKIKQMRGHIDFLHRMKIAVIEEAFQQTKRNLLYADSDTFFTADPGLLMQTLTPDKSYMHLHEYTFAYLVNTTLPAGKSFLDFLDLIKSQSFQLADGTVIKVNPEQSSWNAGVMMFHQAHQAFIPDVYALTDQFYPPTKNHASEQYAFSILLQTRTQLNPCDEVVYHYWYAIKKQITDQFLERELTATFEKKPLKEKLAYIKNWATTLPGLYQTHEWMIRDHAIQAFNENRFGVGYKWAVKALLKQPLTSGAFLKDALYHMKRQLTGRGTNEQN